MEQLVAAVRSVLASWDAPKAREYRRLHEISDDLGTAVILQRMVFGNAGGVSGAGVGFRRDPALGDRRLYMDFLIDAQGEDVVGGRHDAADVSELAAIAPDLLAEIERLCPLLERELGDAQEFELTVQDGELFLLQSRTAKRTPWAALKIATEQVREGLISPHAALARLDNLDLRQFDARASTHPKRARSVTPHPRVSGWRRGRWHSTPPQPARSHGPARPRSWSVPTR
jgi:pyruvate,orthophosphate dikinase